MKAALRFEGVVKKFGKCKALDGLDLVVPSGSALGLVGSNGAGKTTSFAVASGLAHHDSGSIDVLGEGAFDPKIHAGRLSVMPQDTNFPPYAKVRELLEFYAGLQGLSGAGIATTVGSVLEWVHLTDRADSKIRTLSHGMRRRVVIAQAFLGSPELILLDEPMSGLDPREVVNIRKLLRNRPGHQTVVISSHNLHELERICDHVAFIEHGKLEKQASMDDVTGRQHTVTYSVGSTDGLDLNALAALVPDSAVEALDQSRIRCRYTNAKHTAAEVNSIILEHLMKLDVDIHEVHRGSDLESAYVGR